jgi:hypothetical protein
MEAAEQGRKCYAIQAFCIHNTNYVSALPEEFYECYYEIKKRWYKSLPIQASCIKITKFDKEVYIRKVKRLKIKFLGKDKHHKARLRDPYKVYRELNKKYLLWSQIK